MIHSPAFLPEARSALAGLRQPQAPHPQAVGNQENGAEGHSRRDNDWAELLATGRGHNRTRYITTVVLIQAFGFRKPKADKQSE